MRALYELALCHHRLRLTVSIRSGKLRVSKSQFGASSGRLSADTNLASMI